MTNEEAIKVLILIRILDAYRLEEAVNMAIVALRAQEDSNLVEIDQVRSAKLDRSRWEGCEMCSRTYRPPEWNGGGRHDFRVSQNALFYHDSKYGWEGIEVKFCPMCGRPLTEEAWAELERRINHES